MVNIQVNGGTATCNSSPERCGHFVSPFCTGIKKDGGDLTFDEYNNLGIDEENFPRCRMIFISTDSITVSPPSSPSPASPTSG